LLDPTDFSPGELEEIFDFADQIIQSPAHFKHLCDSKAYTDPTVGAHVDGDRVSPQREVHLLQPRLQRQYECRALLLD
jgi:hypothetical protein